MEKHSLYDDAARQQEELRLTENEHSILENLFKYRESEDKPLSQEALDKLNAIHESLDEFMDWVFTVQKLCDSGYIHGVKLIRNNDTLPFDSVQFTTWSYITLEGIRYLKGTV